MENYQRALTDGVDRYLSKPHDLGVITEPENRATIEENSTIFFGKPPEIKSIPENTAPHLRLLVRKFDPAARDARNRKLGKMGEEKVLIAEKARLAANAYPTLPKKSVGYLKKKVMGPVTISFRSQHAGTRDYWRLRLLLGPTNTLLSDRK